MDKNQLTEELMSSILMEDISEMKRLIVAGADINSLGVNNNRTIVTPLGRACAQGNREMVQELIKLGADINLNDMSYGDSYKRVSSPLILAMQNNQDTIVNDLVDAGADLKAMDKDGNTALIIAVQKNKRDLVKNLIKAGASVSVDNYHNENLLTIAVKNNNEEILNDLIESGAKNPSSISSIAFKEGHVKLAKNLIERGYSFNAYPTNMETTFLNGYYKNKVEDYIKNPSLINEVDKNGETLLLTVTKNNLSDLAVKLINSGANLDSADKQGNTALLYAARNKNNELIEVLVKAGSNVNSINSKQESALILSERNIDTIDMLIKAGANVNQQEKDGNTVLMYASLNTDERIIKLLIDSGADLNLQNKDGHTALMMTTEYMNREEIATQLLEAGADINLLDKDGRNASDHALEHDRDTIVDLIKQKAKDNSPEGVISKIFGLRKTQDKPTLKNT